MTRPKWERQRDKALKHLQNFMMFTFKKGRLDLDDDNRKIHFHISFVKDGKLNEIFFTQFFAASYAILKNWYSIAHKDQKGKKLIRENPQIVTLNSMYATYSKWNEIQKILKEEKMKIDNNNIPKPQ